MMMKILLINGSPKKKMSASGFLLTLQSLFVRGDIQRESLRTKGDHGRILKKLKDTGTVIFFLPLYVDGVPSHVLYFMKDMEGYCRVNQIHLKVYLISNAGFIEGKQNEALMQVFKNFCHACACEWCGGIGIGGGVMLNVLRILFFVFAGIFLLGIIISGVQRGDWLPVEAIEIFLRQIAIFVFLYSGVLFYMIRMAGAVNKGEFSGVKYTRVLVPSFLFIIIANIFFIIISLGKGGIFRGWLR